MTDRDPWRGMGALGRRVRAVFQRVLGIFRHGSLDADLPADPEADLDEVVRAHLEMAAEEYEARGMSPAEARRDPRRNFGGVDRVKERLVGDVGDVGWATCGQVIATLDSPDQGAEKVPISPFVLEGNTLKFAVSAVGGLSKAR